MTTRYPELLRRCETDPDVVGVVLSGSQARDMATGHSDFDVYVNFVCRAAKSRRDGRPDLARLDEWDEDDLDLLRGNR